MHRATVTDTIRRQPPRNVGSNFVRTRSLVPAPQALDEVHATLRSPGVPMEAGARSHMEKRFGADFSRIRIHADQQASSSARAINATAYTVGQHLVFHESVYRPQEPEGRRLIAHELVHALQAAPSSNSNLAPLTLGGPLDAAESEAERSGLPVSSRDSPGTIRRLLTLPLAAGGGYGGLMERQRHPTRGGAAPEVAVPSAIQGGQYRMTELSESQLEGANLTQRMAILHAMIDAWWTGNAEEETILRVLHTVPLGQASALANDLKKEYSSGESYYDALERVVDMGNNLMLHAELSRLKVKAMGVKKGTEALTNAPVLPFHDVIGFFEDPATFSLKYTSYGKVIVDYHREGPLYSSPRFGPEMWKLGSKIFDPDQVLVIHDWDTGRFVPFVAADLVGYTNQQVRTFLGNVATVVSMVTPIGAAKTVAGKIALVTLERVLPALILLVDENRLNLVEWFPKWGPRMIYFADMAKIGMGLYGLGRFALSAGSFFRNWQKARQAARVFEGAEDTAAEAEKAAAALEKQADSIFEEVNKLQQAEPHGATEAAKAPSGASAEKAAAPPSTPAKAPAAQPPELQSAPAKSAAPPTGPSFEDVGKELGLEKPGSVTPPAQKTTFAQFTIPQGANRQLAADAIKRLEAQTGLKLPPDRVLEAPWAGRIRKGGKATSQTTSAGWQRNESRFWTIFDDAFKDDAKLIGPDRRVTAALAKKYGWPDEVVGAKLVHHHIDDGPFVVALPASRHGAAGYYSKVHPKVTIEP